MGEKKKREERREKRKTREIEHRKKTEKRGEKKRERRKKENQELNHIPQKKVFLKPDIFLESFELQLQFPPFFF